MSELREHPQLPGENPADARGAISTTARVEVSEESKPGVIEVLCDECETALNFDEAEEAIRKEVLLTLGAR